jgi:lantibiotic biosynthesis protein
VIDAHLSGWQRVSPPDLAAAALPPPKEVASRLRDLDIFQAAVQRLRGQSRTPNLFADLGSSCYSGHAGLALLFAELDRSFPAEEWDIVGHQYMQVAIRTIKRRSGSLRHLGLGALSGLLFATWSLSHGETRYLQTLSTLEEQALPDIRALAENVIATHTHGCSESLYDHISGLAGMGVYLLCRRHVPLVAQTLHIVLKALIYLTEEEEGIPHWHIPPQLADPGLLNNFPNGYLNCGMAHGIPGPLALLSLARSGGVEVSGLDAGIHRAADWLCRHHRKDAWGINWPRVYPIGQPTTESASMRTAWCYGIPGVARALWLAGKALDCSAYRELALAGMQSVYRRSTEARQLDKAGFCHGSAGLLQITLRFANETGEAFCTELASSLCEQLLASYDPETLLGYRGRIMGEEQLDLPGILEGAAGNALALLAASTAHEPSWDRFFLLR